jgi:hypothetical protein
MELPHEVASQMDMLEGTVKLGVTLPRPLDEPPPERETLIQGLSPAKTVVRIDLDEDMRVHFVRQAPGAKAADVEVDVASLRGATQLDFWCVWSPTEMRIHVVDREDPDRNVYRSISSL